MFGHSPRTHAQALHPFQDAVFLNLCRTSWWVRPVVVDSLRPYQWMRFFLPKSIFFLPFWSFNVNPAEIFPTGPHEAMSEPQEGEPDVDRTRLGVPQGPRQLKA